MSGDEQVIRIDGKAFNRLSRARREGENLSDVTIRLSGATLEGLQTRGEQTVETSDGRKLILSIDQDKCRGAMSCVTLAPAVFAYDTSEEGHWRRHDEPLGMREVEAGEVESEALSLAGESCPYKAIQVRDAKTRAVLAP